ncbi:hypothetical protein FO519_000642 [Halicephalobus sp. NKZ332]|nr:hypothetical protein FO519_000642 [Halicephalobus sp. NKZ332]
MDDVVEIACKRNPMLTLCKTVSPVELDSPLDEKTEPLPVRTADIFSSKNMDNFQNLTTTTVSNLARNDENKDESTTREPEHKEITKDEKVQILSENTFFESLESQQESHEVSLKKKKEKYCHEFTPKFDFYCQGPGRYTVSEKDQSRLVAFCLSVKETCLPDRVPCTPECDEKIHNHCNLQCKCDYLYPMVIKFCSPSIVPSLEAACHSWFSNCGKIFTLSN